MKNNMNRYNGFRIRNRLVRRTVLWYTKTSKVYMKKAPLFRIEFSISSFKK